MEGNASVYHVHPVSRTTGQGRADILYSIAFEGNHKRNTTATGLVFANGIVQVRGRKCALNYGRRPPTEPPQAQTAQMPPQEQRHHDEPQTCHSSHRHIDGHQHQPPGHHHWFVGSGSSAVILHIIKIRCIAMYTSL